MRDTQSNDIVLHACAISAFQKTINI